MKLKQKEVEIINKVLSVWPMGSLAAKFKKPAWVGGEPMSYVPDWGKEWRLFEEKYGSIEMTVWERASLWIDWIKNVNNKPTKEDWDFFAEIDQAVDDMFPKSGGGDNDLAPEPIPVGGKG